MIPKCDSKIRSFSDILISANLIDEAWEKSGTVNIFFEEVGKLYCYKGVSLEEGKNVSAMYSKPGISTQFCY